MSIYLNPDFKDSRTVQEAIATLEQKKDNDPGLRKWINTNKPFVIGQLVIGYSKQDGDENQCVTAFIPVSGSNVRVSHGRNHKDGLRCLFDRIIDRML